MTLSLRIVSNRLARAHAALGRMGPWRLASVLALLVLMPVAVRLALDAGISWDEEKQFEYGKRLLAWYRSGFTDRSSFSFIDLYLYGGLFDLPAQWLISSGYSPWGPYETRHVMTALIAVLGIVAVWMTANRVAGPRAAFIAGAMLALTPIWVGHGLFNCKDIPFATSAAFVIYFILRIAARPLPVKWTDAGWTALSVGCALGVRSGGMFLLAYPAIAVFARWFSDAYGPRGEPVRATRGAVVSILRLACALPLAWGVMLMAWPWAQVSPVLRPLKAAAIARHFAWGGLMRFDGRVISTNDLPASYLPVWFKVTLPDTYALAGICAIVLCARAWKHRPSAPRCRVIALLIVFILAPYMAVVVTRPVLYDAHRHFLFLVPAMALLGGLAVDGFIAAVSLPRFVRSLAAASLLVLLAVTAYDMRSLHPYEYLYFNRMSGGLPRQAERFETDYWGLSYREAFEWVVRNRDPGGTSRVHVTACNILAPLRYYREQWHAWRFVVEEQSQRAQISIAMLRGECKDVAGRIIHAVERQGVPLAFVRQRDSSAYASTCRNCVSKGHRLHCECKTDRGQWVQSSVRLPCNEITNSDGHLLCQ